MVFPLRPLLVAVSERFNIRKAVFIAAFLLFLGSRICFLQVPANPSATATLVSINSSTVQFLSAPCPVDGIHVIECTKVCASRSTNGQDSTVPSLDQLLCKGLKKQHLSGDYGSTTDLCPVISQQTDNDLLVFESQSFLHSLDISLLRNISTLPGSNESISCDEYMANGFVYRVNKTHLNDPGMDVCSNFTSMICSNAGIIAESTYHEHTFSVTFWLCFLLFFVSSLSEFVIISALDAVAYGLLLKTKSSYGLQRVCGSIGYSVAALPAAFLLDVSSGAESEIDFSIPVYIGSGILLITTIVFGTLKIPSKNRTQQVHKILCKVIKSADVLVFFFICAFLGALHLSVEMFLFWYLKELGSSQLTMGLAVVSRTAGELVCLVLSGFIIKKIGEIKAIYLSILANVVRMGAYSFLNNPWYVLPIEPLHGLTFCLMWAAMSHHASVIAPASILFTFQSVLSGIMISIGGGSGVLLTGCLFDNVGPVWTFRYYSIASAVVLISYCSLQTWVFNRRPISTINEEVHVEEMDSAVPLKDKKENVNG
ncbi:uncharacterized protein LOC135473903 [Liolophura sinensis]|uniref:uncharacterized protein LOC135473903 n=1 Tax=Liolophura sinensis TaxID=3198878 RepID=UPI003158181F